jgi:hypothetical protein
VEQRLHVRPCRAGGASAPAPHQVKEEASLELEPGAATAAQDPDTASPLHRATTSGAQHSSGGAQTRSRQSKQRSGRGRSRQQGGKDAAPMPGVGAGGAQGVLEAVAEEQGQVEQQVLGTGARVQGVHEVLVPPPPASDLGPSDQALSPAPASSPEQAQPGGQQLCGEAMHGGESWSDCSPGLETCLHGNLVSNQRSY